MKCFALAVFCLLIAPAVRGQEQAIKLTNQKTQKEIIIQENKRIKVKMQDGRKFSGRYKIENPDTLSIRGQTFALADVVELKRNPLLISTLTGGVLVYAGALTAGMGAIIGIFVQSSGFLLAIPGAALIYTGLKAPTFSRKFTPDNNWDLELLPASGLRSSGGPGPL